MCLWVADLSSTSLAQYSAQAEPTATVLRVQVRNATAMAVSAERIYVTGSNGVKAFDRHKLQLVSCLPAPRTTLSTPSIVQTSPRSSASWDPQPAATDVSVTSADHTVCVRYADQRLVCWQESVDGAWKMLWQRQGASGAPSAAALSSVTLATASSDGQV